MLDYIHSLITVENLIGSLQTLWIMAIVYIYGAVNNYVEIQTESHLALDILT